MIRRTERWGRRGPDPEDGGLTAAADQRVDNGEDLVVLGAEFTTVLLAAQHGAAWALQRLWDDVGPLVVGYLRLQGAEEPEDLASEVFLNVFGGIGRFSGEERRFRSWVLVIAHRRLLDERRRRARRPTFVAEDAAAGVAGGDVAQDALAALGGDDALSLLGHLSADQRAVLVLRILADASIEQVAEIIGKSPGAVKALQHRAVRRLRQVLSKEGVSR